MRGAATSTDTVVSRNGCRIAMLDGAQGILVRHASRRTESRGSETLWNIAETAARGNAQRHLRHP